MPRVKPAAVLTARPDASGAFVVDAPLAELAPIAAQPRTGRPLRRVATTTEAQATPGSSGRVKLTEAVVSRLEGHLSAQGRDLAKTCDVWDDVVRGLLLRREPSGRKTWALRVHVAGRRSRVTLGTWPTLGVLAAREAAKVKAAEVTKGADPIADKRAAQRAAITRQQQQVRAKAATVGVFIEGEYKAWAEKRLRGHKQTLAALRRDFSGWWALSFDGITRLDAERWRRDQLKRGVSAATVNREWGRFRAAWGKAFDWDIATKAPIRIKRLTLDKRHRTRFLEPEERTRLLAALDTREAHRRAERERMREWQRARGLELLPEHGTYTDHLAPAVRLALGTGLRRGELLGLRWSAIDFRRSLIHVEAATSKSGQSRDLPMSTEARAVLTALHDQQQPDDPSAWLFTLPGGERLQSIGNSWDRLLKEAKITGFRWHDMRHTFASNLVQSGVDIYAVSRLLGHASIELSQRYSHLSTDYLRDAVAKLDTPAPAVPVAPMPATSRAPLAAVQ